MNIIVENPAEVQQEIVGQKLYEFKVLTGEDAYCTTDTEILMEFSNGKEMRIYIDREGRLCVYSD